MENAFIFIARREPPDVFDVITGNGTTVHFLSDALVPISLDFTKTKEEVSRKSNQANEFNKQDETV